MNIHKHIFGKVENTEGHWHWNYDNANIFEYFWIDSCVNLNGRKVELSFKTYDIDFCAFFTVTCHRLYFADNWHCSLKRPSITSRSMRASYLNFFDDCQFYRLDLAEKMKELNFIPNHVKNDSLKILVCAKIFFGSKLGAVALRFWSQQM